jgi:signal transduction histidine kinase
VSRRISLVVTALIAALLVLAVVPLGVSLTANARASFRFDTRAAAAQLAAQAEEYLADHHAPTAMYAGLHATSARGDCAAVFGPSGARLAATPCTAAAWQTVRPARGSDAVDADTADQDGKWLRVTLPVGDGDEDAGSVVYARSVDGLDDRIAVLWGWLALTGAAVLLLGVVFAVRLARWVAGPLEALGAAAARLGDGALDARAAPGRGPREVAVLAAAFNRMAERTETLVHGHRAWVADVSHQLRTPLTALRLRLDVLADEVGGQGPPQDGNEIAAELAGVQEEIARLSRLVDGLLAVARAEAAVPRPEPVRADLVAAERIAAWEPVARERGVALAPAEQDDQGPVIALAGPGDLEQMLDNLLANALDAVPAGGRVRVGAGSAQGRAVLSVADDGPGMDDAAKADAFRRFGRSGHGGAGLGLAIVHRLAAANGGEVRLADTPGGGLTAVLDLPAAPAR